MLNIKIQKYKDILSELFSDTTFKSFETKMLTVSNKIGVTQESKNKIKGDLFEIFGAFVLKYFGNIPSILFFDFKLSDNKNDYGVDGYGISCEGNRKYPVVAQFKYRSNRNDIIPYSGALANTNSDGYDNYNISKDDPHNIYVITTGKVSFESEKYFGKRLVIIDKSKIEQLVNNHIFFWEYCNNYIRELNVKSAQIQS